MKEPRTETWPYGSRKFRKTPKPPRPASPVAAPVDPPGTTPPGAAHDPRDAAERARTFFHPSPLADVAHAVARASTNEKVVYVERIGDQYRWSIAHKGGSYPLLRTTARYLGIDYQTIMVGFRTVDGFAVLCRDPQQPDRIDEFHFIELDNPTTAPDVETRIRAAFGRPEN